MTYLLDSQVIVWALAEPKKLQPSILAFFDSSDVTRFVSPLSFWELEIKRVKRKIEFKFTFEEMLRGLAARELPITGKHVQTLRILPMLHQDPFDRMLIAQAISEGLTLVTSDGIIQKYPVSILKA